MILLGLIFYKFFKGSFKEILETEMELLNLPNLLSQDIFNREHNQIHFGDNINLFIQNCKESDKKSVRISKNQKLYELETAFHKGNIAELRLCIKNNLERSNAKILIEDAIPGII